MDILDTVHSVVHPYTSPARIVRGKWPYPLLTADVGRDANA
ncbi:MAG: hypothetical protein ABIQ70_01645 [Dokdonella sp.]